VKPIKLTVQAFGPFAGKEEIDFTSLGNNPLFLINGPTGAGKSSILDAICFALYSQTTGAERDPQQMRCDHSKADVLCEVSLEFMLGPKRYRIWRSPMQDRPKNRGDGITTKPGEAKLWYLDGSDEGVLLVSKSVGDATKQINQLMGLGVEQFRQVMVLPQGKFRELLMADSKDRETIFSQLFETHIYKKIETKLKEQASGIKQAVEHHQSKVRGILEGVNVASHSDLRTEIEVTSPLLMRAKSEKDLAQSLRQNMQTQKDAAEALNLQFDELAIKQKALASTHARKYDIETKQSFLTQALKAQSIYHLHTNSVAHAEKLESIHNQHAISKAKLTSAEGQHTQALEHVKKAKVNAAEIDVLKVQQSELLRFSKQLLALDDANKTHLLASTIANKSKQALDDNKQALAELVNERQIKEATALDHASALEALAPLQQTLEKHVEKHSERVQLDSIQSLINEAIKQQGNDQTQLEKANLIHTEAKTTAAETELLWHQSQAFLLAKELNHDQPCPVCGSKVHPKPANLENSSARVSKDQVDRARQKEATCRESMQAAKDKLAATTNLVDTQNSKAAEQTKRLAQFAEIPRIELFQKQTELAAKVDLLKDLQKTKSSVDQRIADIKSIQAQRAETLLRLEKNWVIDNNAFITAQISAQQLNAQIPIEHHDANQLNNTVNGVITKIAQLSQHLKTAEFEFVSKQSLLDSAIATKNALLVQLSEQQKVSDIAVSEWQQALHNSEFKHLEQFLQARLDEPQQITLQQAINDYQTERDSLYAVVQQLSQSLNEHEKTDITLMAQTLSEQSRIVDEKDQAWRSLDARSNNLLSINKMLDKADLDNKALNDQYSIIGTLSEVATGSTGNKISLQRFVLSVLLDDVLIQASQRLHIMSNGRYQLLRKEDRARGNKASGLELEVHDGNTGKPRSVATLSGGESFMAALSLALGLSDVVQSYAGGIRLDTLFIDEGFGSLDTESLDAAIRVLIDLQASGRMIGIISHVSELKEQMAKRIDVLSSPVGSSISIVSV
jgi:exonuclease SbcC